MTQELALTHKQLSYQTSKQTSFSKDRRKAETRTKIQLGGLLIKSGLTHEFAIEIGSDLQFDAQAREKATVLLGALIEMNQNLSRHMPRKEKHTKKEEWAVIGREAFVEHFFVGKGKR